MSLSRYPARMKTITNAPCSLLCALRFAWQVLRSVGSFFCSIMSQSRPGSKAWLPNISLPMSSSRLNVEGPRPCRPPSGRHGACSGARVVGYGVDFPATRTRIERSHQHEPRRILRHPLPPRDRHLPVLQPLTQRLQCDGPRSLRPVILMLDLPCWAVGATLKSVSEGSSQIHK